VYGQESNQTTWKLSKMNLAIRNINSKFVVWNTEGTFLKDAHPDLKADFILANPPFNQSDWGVDLLQEDGRWKQHGTPPSGNANFGWMQHMLYHLAPRGVMATVLSNGSLSSNTSGEGDIRKSLVENDLVECIVALPKQLFYNTGIPACIWFLRREKASKTKEVLFIDASEMGYMKDSTHRDFTESDISKITDAYLNWRKDKNYEDEKGFCKSASNEEIIKHGYALTPGRYVGSVAEEEDVIPFDSHLSIVNDFLKVNSKKERDLDERISEVLGKNFPNIKWTEINFTSNQIIIELAHRVFKEWFEKFNYPGATGELADSVMGQIPQGWQVKKLSDEFDISIGRTPPRKEKEWFSKTPTGMKWISIKDIGNSGTYISNTSEYLTNEAVTKFNIPIIPKNTTILSFKMTVGKLAITTEEMLSNEAIAHLKLKENSTLSSEFIYLFLQNLDFNALGSTSSIVTAINSTMIKNLDVLIPETNILIKFQELISALFEKIKYRTSQFERLESQRDLVKSSLINGESSSNV